MFMAAVSPALGGLREGVLPSSRRTLWSLTWTAYRRSS